MKVLIVSHYFPPHIGGIEFVTQNQAKYLTKLGAEVTILTSAVEAKKGIFEHEDGYIIYRLPVFNFFEKQFKIPFPIFYPSLLTRSYQLVKSSDIVHLHDSFYLSSIVSAFWAFVFRKPVVLTQHVEISPYPQKAVNAIQRAVYRTAGRFVFRTSTRITVVNSGVKNFLMTHNVPSDKIVKLPNGIDISQFSPVTLNEKIKLRRKHKLPSDKVIVLFVGRFIPLKGFTKLLKCSSSEHIIALAGGNAPSGYENDEYFTFLGPVAQKEISEIYRCCDIFILPSDGEGFPLTLQEAMASGLPVITNDDPGYDIYGFDRKYIELIRPTIPKIKSAMNKLVRNAQLRKSMAAYSRQFAQKNFSVEHNTQKLINIYNEVMS